MGKILLLLINMLITCSLFAQNSTSAMNGTNYVIQGGLGLGSVIAVVISWSRYESILLAIFHGILGWLYVIYFALTDSE